MVHLEKMVVLLGSEGVGFGLVMSEGDLQAPGQPKSRIASFYQFVLLPSSCKTTYVTVTVTVTRGPSQRCLSWLNNVASKASSEKKLKASEIRLCGCVFPQFE